jgi:hypothetical protein
MTTPKPDRRGRWPRSQEHNARTSALFAAGRKRYVLAGAAARRTLNQLQAVGGQAERPAGDPGSIT